MTLEACVSADDVVGGAGITVTTSVTVDVGAETVIVVGDPVIKYVTVSVAVSVVVVGGVVTMAEVVLGGDIESVSGGSITEEITPFIVVTRESTKEPSTIEADCEGVV